MEEPASIGLARLALGLAQRGWDLQRFDFVLGLAALANAGSSADAAEGRNSRFRGDSKNFPRLAVWRD